MYHDYIIMAVFSAALACQSPVLDEFDQQFGFALSFNTTQCAVNFYSNIRNFLLEKIWSCNLNLGQLALEASVQSTVLC